MCQKGDKRMMYGSSLIEIACIDDVDDIKARPVMMRLLEADNLA
jgi:hypothetical protein